MLTQMRTDAERILALLSPYTRVECAAPVFADVAAARRMLAQSPFTTPELAERTEARLHARYRAEIAGLYGTGDSPVCPDDSAWQRLAQLMAALVRVAIARLCLAGAFSLTRGQIAASDGLLARDLAEAIAAAQAKRERERERPLARMAR